MSIDRSIDREWVVELLPRASSGTWWRRAMAMRGTVGTAGPPWWCHWPHPSWIGFQRVSHPPSRSPTSQHLHTHKLVVLLACSTFTRVAVPVFRLFSAVIRLTEGPDVRLAAIFTVVQNFRRRPLHRELCTVGTGVLVVQNVPAHMNVQSETPTPNWELRFS